MPEPHWARTRGRPPPSGGFFPVRLFVWAPTPEGSAVLSRHRRTCGRSPQAYPSLASGARSAPPLPDVRGRSGLPRWWRGPSPAAPCPPRACSQNREAGRRSGWAWGPAPSCIGGMSSCPLSGRHEPLPATWAFLESGGSRLRPQPGEPLSAQPPSAAAVPETPLAPWPAQAARHLLLPRQALCRPWPWDGKVPRVAGGENAATASFFLLWSARKRRPVATSLPQPQEVWLVGGGEGPLRQAPAAGASGGLLPLPAQASWWLQGPLCPLLNGLFSVLSSP